MANLPYCKMWWATPLLIPAVFFRVQENLEQRYEPRSFIVAAQETLFLHGAHFDTLQALMQHKDYQTTQRYINMARQLKPAAQNLFVPELPPKRAMEG